MQNFHLVPYPEQLVVTSGYATADAKISEKENSAFKKESYHLKITENEIFIEGDKAGIFYAHITLKQLRLQFGDTLPCMEIQDAPRFAHRGFMLDSSRHFLPKEDVLRIIDVLALFKINRLHWHLIDDQGFRVEISAFPKLTEIGSVRGRSHFGLVDEYKNNCGYFTQTDIKEIVAYAKERMIEIIPEIEIPGHESAMLAAYPEIGCQNAPVEVVTTGGIFDNLICAGKEESFAFVTKILDELIELFPYEMIHIGGDEACKRKWRTCPDCQKKIKELGLKDENALQQWFVIKVQRYLKEKGKTAIVWNDSLRGDKLPEDCVVQMWMGDKDLIAEFAERGGKIIQSSTESFYLDYPYAMWDVQKILNFKLCPDFLAGTDAIIGVECPLWSERVLDLDREFYQMIPRLPAMAECGWTAEHARNNDSFIDRYTSIDAYLQTQGICGAPKEYWNISPKLAEQDMDNYNKTIYTPEYSAEMERQEAMMAIEREIYGDER
ncbi:MAG: beta-N-acetylhexosaminidase [Lachnospiraceae bacterium]|nr:beta-N-acetylhexosaminidase [Lachnospiraceae bacterium]